MRSNRLTGADAREVKERGNTKNEVAWYLDPIKHAIDAAAAASRPADVGFGAWVQAGVPRNAGRRRCAAAWG